MPHLQLPLLAFFLFCSCLLNGQANWTALQGPGGMAGPAPEMSANGTLFRLRKLFNQVEVSADMGDTWVSRNLPLPGQFSVPDFEMQPNGEVYAHYDQQLFHFRQDIQDWEPVTGFEGSLDALTDHQNRLWKLLQDGSLLYTANLGGSFTQVLPDVPYNAMLALHNDGHNLLVLPDAPDDKVFHFTGSGQKQQVFFNVNNFHVEWVKYNPYSNAVYLFSNDGPNALKRSLDGGLTWSNLTLPNAQPTNGVRDVQFTQTGEVWLVDGLSVFVSNNEGDSWMPLNSLSVAGEMRISADGQKVFSRVAECGQQVFYTSLNHGANWTDKSDVFNEPTVYRILKGNNQRLYAESCRRNGVDYSTDEGLNWQQVLIPVANGTFSPQTICKTPGGVLLAPGNNVIYKSVDSGNSWQTIGFNPFPIAPYHRIISGADGTLYVLTNADGGFYSTDLGNSWQQMQVPPDFINIFFNGYHFHPNGHLYRGTQFSIYRFMPEFDLFMEVDLPPGSFSYAFTVTSTGRLIVIMVTVDAFILQKMYVSDDEGETFQEVGNPPAFINGTAFMMSGSGVVLLKIDQQYYRSLDDGLTWTPFFTDTDLPASPECFYFSADNYLYAGLVGETVHRTAEKVVSVKETKKLATWKVFPNPADGVLQVEIPAQGMSQYHIYDALGRQVQYQGGLSGKSGLQLIEIDRLERGVYLLECLDEKGGTVSRSTFIKQ